MKNEKIKTSFFKIFACFTVFLLSLNVASLVSADESGEGSYSIHIVKYKLSERQLSSSTLPQTPTGSAIGDAKDSEGNILEVMPGVRYQIDKVVPSNDRTEPFEVAPDNQTQEITTDASGQASLRLPEGIYRVTELVGGGITQAAAPVIVQLPLSLQNGEVLKDVFIYPKSSVTTGTPSSDTPPSSSVPTKIPNTAENIDSAVAVYGILGAVVLLGLYGLFIKPTKLS